MSLEIKIPSPGESITEVEIGKWLVKDGAVVDKDQEIAEIESDKATFSLSASAKGKIQILLKEGQRVPVGSVACVIETEANLIKEQDSKELPDDHSEAVVNEKEVGKPEVEITQIEKTSKTEQGNPDSQQTEKELGEQPKSIKPPVRKDQEEVREREIQQEMSRPQDITPVDHPNVKFTAAAKAVMDAEGLSYDEVVSGIHRLTRQDVESVVSLRKAGPIDQGSETEPQKRSEERTPMSALRRKLSQRLIAVRNETAMLTTFNEIDLSQLMALRAKYQKPFTEKYGVKLGYMSFFMKASGIALQLYPIINSMIDGEEIIKPNYQDIGIAVQTEKGLMAPIVRNAGIKSIPELEKEIAVLSEKAKNKKITVQEMTGGTFTITNGGIFGSLMSTPILNPPQSAILGMHAIKDRPVAIENKVEIRPMMYVALSYDHRLIDGKDSVSFLIKIKELIENPISMLFSGKKAEDLLLGL